MMQFPPHPRAIGSAYRLNLDEADDRIVYIGLALSFLITFLVLAVFVPQFAAMHNTPKGPYIIEAKLAPQTDVELETDAELASLPYIDMSPPRVPTALTLETQAFINLFGDGDISNRWYYAQYRGSNHYWVDFVKKDVVSSIRGLDIYIREKANAAGRFRWTAGQVNTKQNLGFGRYEAIMKPAKGSGLVSSFFTYTGAYFGDAHDEIDFEFVGKRPYEVELNSFRNGRGNGHKRVKLPFDATADYHLYAYEWLPDSIRWYVDGELVGELTGDESIIPQTPGKIYLNLWSGRTVEWHGKPRFGKHAHASFACVSYRPLHDTSRSCSDFYTPPKK